MLIFNHVDTDQSFRRSYTNANHTGDMNEFLNDKYILHSNGPTRDERFVGQRFIEIIDYLHQPDVLGDSYLCEIGPNPFEKDTSGSSEFRTELTRIFQDTYGVSLTTIIAMRTWFLQPSDYLI